MAFQYNQAKMNVGGTSLQCPPVEVTILYSIGKEQDAPPKTYVLKPIYFPCNTTAQIQIYYTSEEKSKNNKPASSKTEYVFVCKTSSDVSGIDRNIDANGDYITVKSEPNIWYKVIKLIQRNGNYCTVKCIQTSQDPTKGNTNVGQGVNVSEAIW